MPTHSSLLGSKPTGDITAAAECAADWWAEAHNRARRVARHAAEPALEIFRRALCAAIEADLVGLGVCILTVEGGHPTGALLRAARAAGLNCVNRNMWPDYATVVVEPTYVVLDFRDALWCFVEA